MNKLSLVVLAGLLSGCLIPVDVGENDAGAGGGVGGGAGGGAGGGSADAGMNDAGPNLPDLTITLLQLLNTGMAGSNIPVMRTFANIGTANAPAAKYRYFVSDNAIIAATDIPLELVADGGTTLEGSVTLAAGVTDTQTDTLKIPTSLPNGTYYIGAIIDSSAAVAELVESNNAKASLPLLISNAVCTNGNNGSCNDDINMSALAGTCVASACVCNPGFEINPLTGLCKLYFARFPISATRPETYALAVEATQNRAGLAWIVGAPDAGDYDVYYQDWLYSAPAATPPQKLATVQKHAGIAVAFRGSNPVVSFLGGGSDGSALWAQSDAVIFERNAAGTWQTQVVATMGDQAVCGNPVSDLGLLVGLWPALAVDGTKTFLAWRDGHNGQFPQQDWAGSDVELAETSTGAAPWTYQCAKAGGVDKQAHGQSNKIVVAGGQPALIYTHGFSGISSALDVSFVRRTAGGWQTPIKLFPNQGVMSPAADWLGFAHRTGTGYAVVAGNSNLGRATLITTSTDGLVWQPSRPVGNSAGGADVAIDSNGLHQVSVVDCPLPIGTNCTAPSELVVSIWRETPGAGPLPLNFLRDPIVDPRGANGPTRLGILPNGKRVVLYLTGISSELRLAVER